MLRPCDGPNCELYALSKVSTAVPRRTLYICAPHLRWATDQLSKKWKLSRLVVSHSSALVLGDLGDWRTPTLNAYDVSRQIGA
jgi:hypothetical protein